MTKPSVRIEVPPSHMWTKLVDEYARKGGELVSQITVSLGHVSQVFEVKTIERGERNQPIVLLAEPVTRAYGIPAIERK